MRNPFDDTLKLPIPAMNASQFPPAASLVTREEYVCWSRMQAEAGQGLSLIVARKERERVAGEGVFFWGVGNAPATISNVLARAGLPIPVVFSVMKSRPKAVDVAPSRVVAWRRFIDERGVERELPKHALITSRADSASGPKRVHYALMCHSPDPLALASKPRPFDPTAFRNAGGTGAPVGNSQVTALLKRVKCENLPSDYSIDVEARLTGGYWVRLTDPILLDDKKNSLLALLQNATEAEWTELVGNIRHGPTDAQRDQVAEMLF